MSNTGFPEKLDSLLATYQKNVKNVPMEELETKYKKGFQKLKDSIDETAYRILIVQAVSPYHTRVDTRPEDIKEIFRRVDLFYLKEKKYLRTEKATAEGWVEKTQECYLSLVDLVVFQLHGAFGIPLENQASEVWERTKNRPDIAFLFDDKQLRPMSRPIKTFRPAAKA